MSTVAQVKDNRLPRILAGHPWIYESDLLPLRKQPQDGEAVTVRSRDGGFIGKGFYNSRSSIRIRLYTREKTEELDENWLRNRIGAAVDFRRAFGNVISRGKAAERPARRLVWSEADLLSGLIVDQYGDHVVIQTLSLAMDRLKPMIVKILRDLLSPAMILERNDVASRKHEGLAETVSVLHPAGREPQPLEVRLGSALFWVDLLHGQKTGGYLDQQDNWEIVAAHCREKSVLDCFTYHGGFALHAALARANSVTAIDVSEPAIEQARKNAALNRVACDFVAANVFDKLTEWVKAERRFDVVILDPPSFTKSRAKLEDALRGYKQIHLKALKLLPPGGLLATFCCSHHVDAETFRAVALDAAYDTRKQLRLLASLGQPLDHPILPAVTETEYLKGFLFQVL